MTNTKTYTQDKTIVLIGLMGAGKTTIGRRLAKAMDMEFIDSDHEIEAAAGMSVSDIFDKYGEVEFRAVERRVISRLMAEKTCILATGGGAFLNEDTRQLILDNALSIWLDADIDILVERTSRKDTRPILKSGDPKTILKTLARDRNPIYAKADLKVRSCTGPHEQVVENILNLLKNGARP